jgi:hypothetical protein
MEGVEELLVRAGGRLQGGGRTLILLKMDPSMDLTIGLIISYLNRWATGRIPFFGMTLG